MEIYREIGIHEVTLIATVEMVDEGCEPEHHVWCAMVTDEIGFDESLYNKADRIKIEDYIEKNELSITREMEENYEV